MRAFVTGGSGFVGQRLIASLRARGDEVRALARSERAVATVKAAGAEPVRGDLDDERALEEGMRGCDVVHHVAAKVDDWGPWDEYVRANVVGTERVLAAARRAGVPRLVHVSTEAVLVGGPPIVRADETWPRPARPIGPYPKSKGLAEERVLAACSPELATVIVRPRMVWGKGDTTVLPRIAESVKRGQFRWVDGGRYLTSHCHVANVCEGMLLAAERGRPGAIYFLTDGAPSEFRDFLTRQLATLGVTPADKNAPRWLARALAAVAETAWSTLRLGGHPPISRSAIRLVGEEVTVDDGLARRELGYAGRMTVEAGLAEMRG